MNVDLLNRDLGLVLSLRGNEIRDCDWSMEAPNDQWIIVWGGIKVPVFTPGRDPPAADGNLFNRPDVNVKVSVPQDLYDPAPGRPGRVRFYTDVYIDCGLKIWNRRRRGWRAPARYYPGSDPHSGKELGGWSYLCVIPSRYVDPSINILSVLAIVQRFLLTQA